MKILVTGACGYIGRHVVKFLADAGHEVTASDIANNGIDSRAVFCDEPIFSGKENIYELLGRPDACIHLAWRDGFVHNSPEHMKNLSSHFIFLKNMIDGGLPLLSVMGTMHEIGYYEGAIDENTPCNPLSQYGIAKNALRQSVLNYIACAKSNVAMHWLRAYYICGDDRKNNSIFAKLLAAADEGKKTFPFTSGKNKYDFIDVCELAKQISVASIQSEICGIINCCTGTPVTLGEKVESFIEKNQLDIALEYGVFPDRKYDSPIEYGDATKIKEIMNNYHGKL